ncbi:unnamed protein product [Pieris brassicae]|uniref:SH3 domain-containing protein n=1 Tax=Pieris brassicae TaxID=7116 RepID=A0A9P0TUL8_PIEBR|nr:unnamed protein product [Pieris brassicae]
MNSSEQKSSANTKVYMPEDDGFYSDVPISGKLSKSLLALNKYVKKNLLYDDSEDQTEAINNDGAYFSKESSPNDSVAKSDTESVKSNELYTIHSPAISKVNVDVCEKDEIKSDPTKQTDDYKFKQLLENPPSLRRYSNSKSIPNQDHDRCLIEENYSQTFGNTKENEENFVERRSATKEKSQRHSVHDVNWVNRTNIYPDVYAPLPFKSPSRRYVESDVNIHYRCPVRHDPLPLVPERELARQQAEHMKRLYREQKRNKYLQELQDMQSRRHQDNFMPSQKTIVPLNRYDEADRVVARALYTFNGQTARELSFRKGDIINVRRQIDNNWYEGEFHGRIGLFPYNYVELLKGDVAQSPKKPLILEGRARAKFDFTAQTNLELPLKKGELVVLARRIDHNWWEGRVGNKTGIFPDSYVTILQEPSQGKPEPQPILSTDKPVASPAAHGVVNGDKRSLGAHTYTPQHNSAALGNAPPATEPLIGYPAKGHSSPADRGLNASVNLNNTEPLYVDTNAEAVPYRAMYKYRPQNPDELELNEGDTVYVLEKCDDGWYVGSSQRTGRFGTFPGNYVERI